MAITPGMLALLIIFVAFLILVLVVALGDVDRRRRR